MLIMYSYFLVNKISKMQAPIIGCRSNIQTLFSPQTLKKVHAK